MTGESAQALARLLEDKKMNLFDDTLHQLRSFLKEKEALTRTVRAARADWPAGEKGNIVLGTDTGVELGNPRDESASFMVWTENSGDVRDGAVHIIGPDLPESAGKRLPFGKAMILQVKGMDEENCYERHRALELARYDLNLRGYMMRAVSQYLREWSRVSRAAVTEGFTFATLAGALGELYRKIDFVEAVEFVFVTSSPADVKSLGGMGGRVERLIGALNKMASEMSFDCGTCDFTDVCTEVEDLRNMRKNPGGEATGHGQH